MPAPPTALGGAAGPPRPAQQRGCRPFRSGKRGPGPPPVTWTHVCQIAYDTRLPAACCSTDPAAIDAEELADLLGQLAGFAPSHAFHTPGTRAGAEAGPAPPAGGNGGATPGSKSSSASGSTDGASACNGSGSTPATAPQALSRVSAARLRAALDCSLVCVAAFASEQHLPPHQHLESRGLPGASGTGARSGVGGLLLV